MMQAWEAFFLAAAGAAAVLTGLIFVGLSINLKKILSIKRLPYRALDALMLLMAALVISSLMLVPEQPLRTIGAELAGVGALAWVCVSLADFNIVRATQKKYRGVAVLQVVIDQVCVLLYVVGGAFLLYGNLDGLYYVVQAILFSFVKAMMDAWVLLVEINR
jgi:modulator of FtsH protease